MQQQIACRTHPFPAWVHFPKIIVLTAGTAAGHEFRKSDPCKEGGLRGPSMMQFRKQPCFQAPLQGMEFGDVSCVSIFFVMKSKPFLAPSNQNLRNPVGIHPKPIYWSIQAQCWRFSYVPHNSVPILVQPPCVWL